MNSLSIYVLVGLVLSLILIVAVLLSHSSLWDSVISSRLLNFRVWGTPYECGCLTDYHSSSYLGVSYIALLVFFVIFDLELVLLLNIPFQGSMFKSFWCFFFFLFFLFLSYSVEAERGFADWGF